MQIPGPRPRLRGGATGMGVGATCVLRSPKGDSGTGHPVKKGSAPASPLICCRCLHTPTPPPHYPGTPWRLPATLLHSLCVLTPESSCKSVSLMRHAPAFRCQCLPSSSKIKGKVLARCEGSSQVRPSLNRAF